jgi:hypothetical protein
MSNVPKYKLHVCFGGLVICPPYYESKKREHYWQVGFLLSATYSVTKTGEPIVTKFRAINLLYNLFCEFYNCGLQSELIVKY